MPFKFTTSTTNIVLASKFKGPGFLVPILSKYNKLLLTTHHLPTEIVAGVDLCQGMFNAAYNGSPPKRRSLGCPLISHLLLKIGLGFYTPEVIIL